MDAQATGYQSDYQVPGQSQYTVPKSNKLFVLPVTGSNDEIIKPDVMVGIYNQIVAEEKLSDLFYDGVVNNLPDWLNYIYDTRNYVSLVLDDTGKIYHIAWINKFSHGCGFLHHCSLGNYNRKTWPTLKEYYKKLQFQNKNVINTLLGITPEINTKAVRLLSMIGWSILGKIPGICYIAKTGAHVGGVVSYCVINEV